ncbi:MAG: hypothetical protein FJW39_02545 [Acidobacteria bacterium]|nr:hypothetical protein [Acidobacteriota bacterium]
MKRISVLLFAAALCAQHPRPQPRPPISVQTKLAGGTVTRVVTGEGPLPVGKNFLLTVDSNMFDGNGEEMVNTNPSRPSVPYNLHDGPVSVTPVDPTSPADDLAAVFERIRTAGRSGRVDTASIQFGLDILEGNPIPSRPTYSGLPVLHYTGPEKLAAVRPVFDTSGRPIGGNVDVRQIWYGSHIESDVALLDTTAVQNLPWTITYTIYVLHRGADDFSPFNLFFDAPPQNVPGSFGPPHIAMDSTFFPMDEGTRVVLKIKMPPAKYFNLSYTWGWRRHPPRVQVIENFLKTEGGKRLLDFETEVFGTRPRLNRTTQLAAIAKIGDLAPEKVMWNTLREARTAGAPDMERLMRRAMRAWRDWGDRTSLPEGIQADTTADVTLFYANNTIYGTTTAFPKWVRRPAEFKVALLNGDHFVHGYINVDFGGARGWENQFQSTVPVGGTGCDFTFGRAHWWMLAGGDAAGLIDVPPVSRDGVPGRHRVEIQLNWEPSARLRLYQFDPYHHDVAVFSIH